MRWIILSSLLVWCSFAVSGCVHQPDAVTRDEPRIRPELVGSWYGAQRTEEGNTRQWIMRRAADGSYHVQFLVVDTQGHRVEAWEENGVWLAKDTLYATEAQRHSGEQTGKMTPFTTPIQDFYHIINLDQDHFHYVGLQSGNEYTVERIPDDVGFEQLPPSLTGIQVITQ